MLKILIFLAEFFFYDTLLLQNKPLDAGAKVQNLLTSLMSLVPGVVMDSTPFGSTFGDVLIDANDKYNAVSCVLVNNVAEVYLYREWNFLITLLT